MGVQNTQTTALSWVDRSENKRIPALMEPLNPKPDINTMENLEPNVTSRICVEVDASIQTGSRTGSSYNSGFP